MSAKDFLWLNLKELPYFRGLLRAVEARFYQDINLPSPVLDLGCGDGDFASITFDRSLDVGLDPWAGPVRKAVKTRAYQLVIQGVGSQIPFPDAYFSSAFSNSVLEHISDLDPVLAELARVMKSGSTFVFCVPNHNFLGNLSISNLADRLGFRGVGDAYRAFFNRISRHHHCDTPEVWQQRLERAGFAIDRWWHYFSPEALRVLEWGHYFGLPSWLIHAFTKRWILVPNAWNLSVTRPLVEKYYHQSPEHPQGSYTFYITHRL